MTKSEEFERDMDLLYPIIWERKWRSKEECINITNERNPLEPYCTMKFTEDENDA